MTSSINIGETDKWGYTLLAYNGPVELYTTPKEYFTVYLMVNRNDYLTVVRKNREDADNIYDSVCNML